MATIHEINHDSSTTIGDFYNSVVDTDAAISVTTVARLNLSINGVDIDFDAGANDITLSKNNLSSTSPGEFRFRFRIKLDDLTNTNSGVVFCQVDYGRSGDPLAQIQVRGNGGDGGYNIIGRYNGTGKGNPMNQIGTGSDAISSTGEVCIELSVLANSPTDFDYEIFVDGSSVQVENAVSDADVITSLTTMRVRFFPDANISGSMFFDEFITNDDSAASGLCVDAVGTHIWLSTDGGATYTNIGDDATWAANVVGGVVVVPGTAYQTIFAAVGTSLYKTINGGTAWTLETAVGYECDFLDLEKDNTTVFLAKRDAAGTNRASLWDSVGASLTHINTGKSTTGGATSGGDVV